MLRVSVSAGVPGFIRDTTAGMVIILTGTTPGGEAVITRDGDIHIGITTTGMIIRIGEVAITCLTGDHPDQVQVSGQVL